MSKIHKHDWYCEGGPVTVEYEFPLENFDSDPEVKRFATEFGSTLECVHAKLKVTWDELKAAFSEVAALLDGCEPRSLSVQNEQVWVSWEPVNLSPDQFDRTAWQFNANRFLQKIHHRPSCIPAWVKESGVHPDLTHLVNLLGGSTVFFPPFAGVYEWPDIQPAVQKDSGYGYDEWKGIADWEGSIPWFYLDTGDVLLCDQFGNVGCWSHEWTEPTKEIRESFATFGLAAPESAVEKIEGSLSDVFVNLIKSRRKQR